MHGYIIANGVITNAYGPAYTWPFVLGYSGIAAILFGLDLQRKNNLYNNTGIKKPT
jgi:hypothetical protein